MPQFLLQRLAAFLATLLAASLFVFIVLEVLPGDPGLVRLGAGAQPDRLAALREKLGVGRPALERCLAGMGGLVGGDLGISYAYDVPVSELVGGRLVVTVPLGLLSMALTTVIAL